jgi:hypothetical protein
MTKSAPTRPDRAQQGHRYQLHQKNVIALESGPRVRVLFYDPKEPWLGKVVKAHASELKPQPMKYFHGQTPL